MSSDNDNPTLQDLAQTGLVISVKEARKILGKKSLEMTDEQVEALIVNLQFNAESFLLQSGS